MIVKIVRKRQENLKKYKGLDKYNYEKFLTDLIGIRCFILFKTDWQIFHNYIDDEIEDDENQYVRYYPLLIRIMELQSGGGTVS